jgi:signal transduction histidine kinase
MQTTHYEPRDIEWPILCKKRVDLRNVVIDAVDACRAQLEAHHHTPLVRLPPEPVYIEADPVRLMQMLTHLLDNSAKYSEDGGAILISAGGTSSEITIRVVDHGLGITARCSEGMRIGLNLVKRIVELHDGSLEALSAGVGSTFTVRLPRTM